MKQITKIIKLLAALCLCVSIAQADEYVSCTLDLANNHQLQPVVAWLNLIDAPKAERQKTAPENVIYHNISFVTPGLTSDEELLFPRDPLNPQTSDPAFLYEPDALSIGVENGLTTKISLQNKNGTSVVSLTRVRNFVSGNVLWRASGIYKGLEIMPIPACTEFRARFFNQNKKVLDTYKAVIDRASKSWN